MSQEFGQFCRTLRKRAGLTQMQLARKASMAVRTIIYWEQGEREPRSEELAAVLEVLGAKPEEREHAYLLLTSVRGIQLARQEVQARPARNGTQARDLPHFPNVGDLLTALRLRAGLSRSELAARMGLKVSTIAGWERTDHLPEDANVVRLCQLLRALPQEQDALLTRRLVSPWSDQIRSVDSIRAQIQEFWNEINLQDTPLVDLHGIALRREIGVAARLQHSASCHGEYRRLAAHVDHVHSVWLVHQRRITEAKQCAMRALRLLQQELTAYESTAGILNVASCCAVMMSGGNYEVGTSLLLSWLPMVTDPQGNAQIYCDLSYYASAAGHHGTALQYLEQARNSINRSKRDATMHSYYSLALGRIMAHAGRFDDALEALVERSEWVGQASLFPKLIRAEILLQAERRNEAHGMVQSLYTDLDRYRSPMISERVDLLARQL